MSADVADGARQILSLTLVTAAWLVTGCSAQGEPVRNGSRESFGNSPMLLNAHGFSVGAEFDQVSLSCDDGTERVIAPRRPSWQLVTFTSPGDCSACHAHLAGLAVLDSAKSLQIEHVFVSYPVGMDIGTARRQYHLITTMPVCWDSLGMIWETHGIAHTPVTVLFERGHVRLMHDAPLTTQGRRDQLLDSIARIVNP